MQFGKFGRYELCIGEYMSFFVQMFKILNWKCTYQWSRGYRGTQRVLNKVQSTVRWHPKPPKIIEVNKVYTLICCTAWVLILYFSLLMTSKKIWALCYLDNVTKYIHSSSNSKCISTCLVLFWWQDFCAWMTLPTVYLCYIVIPDCGHDKIDTCQFVENITNINLLPFPKP